MYYKIYGIMHASGFNTELANANTYGKAEALIQTINESQYPYFAITEHLRSGSPAIAIYPGVTSDRAPCIVMGLVEYKPNPMENFEVASKLFSTLKEKADANMEHFRAGVTAAVASENIVAASVQFKPVAGV